MEDVKKNCAKTLNSGNNSSTEDQKTPSKTSTSLDTDRSLAQQKTNNKPEFSMPKRSDVCDSTEDGPTKGMDSLLHRRLVNSYHNYYDLNYTSGDESAFVESAEDSDSFTKVKTKQQKAIKKRIKNFSKRQPKGSDSSESFDSSEESVTKAKKLILKTMCKKIHTKNSAKKPVSESLESSENSGNAVLKPCERRPPVVFSSESDSTESQKKGLKAAQISLISKRKKALEAMHRSSSSSISDCDVAARRREKGALGWEEKSKMLSVMKKSVKHSHFKWGSSEEEGKQKIINITKKARNAGTISSEWSGSVSDVRVEGSSENSVSDRDFYCPDIRPEEVSQKQNTEK
ncbi:dentin sialophosphoprotein-like [Argonauta hians]